MHRRTLRTLSLTVLLAAGFGTFCAAESTDDLPRALPALPETSPLPYLRPYWRRNLFKRFLSDQKFLLKSWWRGEARRPAFAVPMIVSVVGASGSPNGGWDRASQRSIESWATGDRRDISEAITRLGDAETGIVLVGTTYLIARWTGNERWQRTASLSAEAMLNAAFYSALLKTVTRRTRPTGANVGAFFVYQPVAGQEPTSFPSGHSMGAFAVATVVALEFRERRWVAWIAYGAAGLVAVSRIALGAHFPSDVLAGAVLGNSLGRMVMHRNGDDGGRPIWSRFEPMIDPNSRGLGIAYRHAW